MKKKAAVLKKRPDASTSPKASVLARKAPSTKSFDVFPVVGIGASAGGLEAIEQFLRHVPESSGMAYVIVQHLDPNRKCILPELLQHATKMNVTQAKQRMKVLPDCVYVIPANKEMSIVGGELHLRKPMAPRGQRLPINYFLQSLALERKNNSVGVILSGMGSDGVVGVRAIKEAAGIVLAQTPASARFDSMPRGAIETGLVDGVGLAHELPALVHTCLSKDPDKHPETMLPDTGAFIAIVKLLRVHTGHDFSLYKKSTVSRRVERRMNIHQIDQVGRYAHFLQENPKELELLFNELLIGVTSFFRDPAAWEFLRDQMLPVLLESRADSQSLRAWVPGCSSGEEAYSLAMVFREAADALMPRRHPRLHIFATDLDPDAIVKARQGIYPESITANISPERLKRFFVQEDHKYRIAKEIRETVVFAQQDVVMDPPFTKLDILVCRNLLIYMETALQKKLLPLFHYSLKPGGILFLGSAETIGGFTNLFSGKASKFRVYQRISPVLHTGMIEFPPSFVPPVTGASAPEAAESSEVNLQALADQVILHLHTPPAVLTSPAGDVVYISGRTGKYLEPAAGKANLNIFAMIRDDVRAEVSIAFQKVVRDSGLVRLKNLKILSHGGEQFVEIVVQKLEEPEALRDMVLIAFKDQPHPPETAGLPHTATDASRGKRAHRQDGEIQRLHEELRTVREEMQIAQEELRSANEELQSANEELQSTNEELTTSTEEMQSMNEELQTVNAELQAKVDELSRIASDMKNLLDSTDIATIFLDGDLNVRRFTPRATKIIRLITSDVGRPLTDLASELDYPTLAEDAVEVLRTLVFSEKQIPTSDGRWFTIRIMPYRTIDDKIDGVVITLADISAHRQLLAASQAQRGTA